MVITVIAVRVVQVTVYEVIHVIPVRNSFVPTARAMHMRSVMTATAMRWRTGGRVCV